MPVIKRILRWLNWQSFRFGWRCTFSHSKSSILGQGPTRSLWVNAKTGERITEVKWHD